jgi:hypothetical protein
LPFVRLAGVEMNLLIPFTLADLQTLNKVYLDPLDVRGLQEWAIPNPFPDRPSDFMGMIKVVRITVSNGHTLDVQADIDAVAERINRARMQAVRDKVMFDAGVRG